MSKITKAVIPCGGMGTRFLPITKCVPKEILPIIDTPVLSYIVDEAVSSGITDILIVLSPDKEAIKKYFTPNIKLEKALAKSGKLDILEKIRSISDKANISFEYQVDPKGSGDAVALAHSFVGKEDFVLAWGDDLMYSEKPVISQLLSAYDKYNCSVLGVQSWAGDDIVKYGVAKVTPLEGRAYKCSSIVEKPLLKDIPSRLASLGRYVVANEIFDMLKDLPLGKGGEYQFTDALASLCASERGVVAYDFEGRRYDMGDKKGAIEATIEYGLRSEEYGSALREYILDLAKKL